MYATAKSIKPKNFRSSQNATAMIITQFHTKKCHETTLEFTPSAGKNSNQIRQVEEKHAI